MMQAWQVYTAGRPAHTVTGEVRVLPALASPQLAHTRPLYLWLPPDYHQTTRRYPVVYMHDGQNLFDAHLSSFGEWQVDETLTALSAADPTLAAIVVGIPHHPTERRLEYSPYAHPTDAALPGKGEAYMQFIVETIKPLVDATFRTRPERAATTLAGSSMGGLISLYGFLRYPAVFGACGVFSPAYWVGQGALLTTINTLAQGAGRIYLDVGTREGSILPPLLALWGQTTSADADAEYVAGVRAIRAALRARGYLEPATLRYYEAAGALHNEAAWAARLPEALRFLLAAG